MDDILRVDDLYFKYSGLEILKDIKFEVKAGDFVGILGPNGCGKTTLLNNINRWLKPDRGSIYIRDVNSIHLNINDLAKHIATVPQNTSVEVAFTVEQVVLMGRNPYLKNFESEKKEDFTIVEEALKVMDIWHLRHKTLSQLSGGERQRVLIARALAQQPDLLLLDEPTSHLDINYQWELLGLLRNLCDHKSLTILAVLHDINLASMFCNKVILLKDHTIFKLGPVNRVITRDNIKQVFNIDVHISYPQGFSHPVITFLNKINKNQYPRPFDRLHVICGGGEGESLLRYLNDREYKVSVGVLNKSDTDWKTAKLLGFTVIEENPFSPISDEKIKENIYHISNADAIILANIPFGHGNLKNIECLRQVDDKKVYILEERDIELRDYTNGEASNIYNDIKKRAVVFKSLDELKASI